MGEHANRLIAGQLQRKRINMRTVTITELRKSAGSLLRRVEKGERFMLSYRGRAVARLEPLHAPFVGDPTRDPFFTVGDRAMPSPKGRTEHSDLDRIVYGGR
jgi:antitoxin (DNA-binding transcriptional repressor) of toxin-antitoxin stability system